MKLIIDIDDYDYKRLHWTTIGKTGVDHEEKLRNFILNGTVIPEGHGDLIDRDELKSKLPAPIEDEYKTAYSVINSMTAIIKADKEYKDADNN